jgi:hypothetical protein
VTVKGHSRAATGLIAGVPPRLRAGTAMLRKAGGEPLAARPSVDVQARRCDDVTARVDEIFRPLLTFL